MLDDRATPAFVEKEPPTEEVKLLRAKRAFPGGLECRKSGAIRTSVLKGDSFVTRMENFVTNFLQHFERQVMKIRLQTFK